MIYIYRQRMGDIWCGAAIEDQNVWATAFAINENEVQKHLLESLPYYKPFQAEETPSPLAKKIFDTMQSIFAGENVTWNFKLERSQLSNYAQKVLDCLSKVPVGYVTTYKALAKTTSGGPRAVGQIMALNPFPPLIPCHRVIKADFSIGGFGGGVKLKLIMLQREDRGFEKPSKVKTEYGLLDVFPAGFLTKD